MHLRRIADTSEAVAADPARSAKVALLADCLRALEPDEVAVAVPFLSGELRQRQIGVGWAALRDLPAPVAEPVLTVREVDEAFTRLGATTGAGSQAERRQQLSDLFARATEPEQFFLRRLLIGELRQGALDGVMTDAIAKAAQVPLADVRRGLMMRGSLGAVAETALSEGVAGLRRYGLEVGRPVRPMLAGTADTVEAALEKITPAAVEWKLDRIRVQIHRSGADVRVFTRSLDDITDRMPESSKRRSRCPPRRSCSTARRSRSARTDARIRSR